MLRSGVLLRLIGALCAAGSLTLARAPISWWIFAPVGVALIVLAVRTARPRTAAVVGALFGVAWTVGVASWLTVVSAVAVVPVAVAMGIATALLAVALRAVGRWPGWPWWSGLLWILAEAAWSAWPLGGFPWLRLAWSTPDSPAAGWLGWAGVAGASLVVAFCGTALAAVVSTQRWRLRSIAVLAVVLLAASWPALRPPASMTTEWSDGADQLDIAAVQSGVPGGGRDLAAQHQKVTDTLADLTVELGMGRDAAAADLVLWPENSTAVDPRRAPDVRRDLQRASRAIDAPLLVGSVVDGPRPGTAYNRTVLWRGGANVGPVYTKRNLVPFGEYVPWRGWLEGLGIPRIEQVPRDMLAGDRQEPFSLAGASIGALICFDVAYPSTVSDLVESGAELLVVQTSNASFGGTRQLEQQLTITRARAIESGRAIVVAATTGVSAVIAPNGQVMTGSEGAGPQVIRSVVPLISEVTPAVAMGRWVVPAASVIVLLYLISRLVTGWTRRRQQARRIGPPDASVPVVCFQSSAGLRSD